MATDQSNHSSENDLHPAFVGPSSMSSPIRRLSYRPEHSATPTPPASPGSRGQNLSRFTTPRSVAGDHQHRFAVPPTSPIRSASRIGKRSKKVPSLARKDTSPGHMEKIAQIFLDAHSSLQEHEGQSPGHCTHPSPGAQGPWTSAEEPVEWPTTSIEMPDSGSGQPAETSSESLVYPFAPDAEKWCRVAPCEFPVVPVLPESASSPLKGSPASQFDNDALFRELFGSDCSSPLDPAPADDEAMDAGSAHFQDPSPDKSMGQRSSANNSHQAGDGYEPYFVLQGIPLPEPMTESEFAAGGRGEAHGIDAWLDMIFDDGTGNDDPPLDHVMREPLKPMSSPKTSHHKKTKSMVPTHPASCATSPKRPKGFRPRSDSNKENQRPTHVIPAELSASPRGRGMNLKSASRREPNTALQLTANAHTPGFLGTQPGQVNRSSRFQPLKRLTSKGLDQQRRRVGADLHGRDVEMKDDESHIPNLSPAVEVHRKQRRPNRSRCPSYFDQDVLGKRARSMDDDGDEPEDLELPDLVYQPRSRNILGESELSELLTRSTPFCQEAEEFEFTGL